MRFHCANGLAVLRMRNLEGTLLRGTWAWVGILNRNCRPSVLSIRVRTAKDEERRKETYASICVTNAETKVPLVFSLSVRRPLNKFALLTRLTNRWRVTSPMYIPLIIFSYL